MKAKIVMVGIVTLLISLFTGCELSDSNENLMKPPKLAIKQEEVKKLLEDILDSEADLINPKNGENTNAIQFVDLDKDNKEEVLVFYILENDTNPLRGLILKKENEDWKIDEGIKGIGYEFESIDYKDITGDGRLEVIIGYDIGERINKGLSIYKYENGKSTEMFNDSYETFVVDNLDKDKKAEIFLVKLNKNDFKCKGELYKFTDEEIKLIDEVKMDGGVNLHYSIKVGLARENQKGIFIEAGVGAHSAITELIVLENGKLNNVFFNEEKEYIDKTFKAYSSISDDIDNDGIIEIPLLREPASEKSRSMAGTPWIHSWYKWDGKEGLNLSSEGYINIMQEYYFKFPQKWKETIAIDFGMEEDNRDELIFSYLDNDNKKYKLFSIVVVDEKTLENKSLEDKYIEIKRARENVYFADIEEKEYKKEINKMKLTIEEIKENFRIYERKF